MQRIKRTLQRVGLSHYLRAGMVLFVVAIILGVILPPTVNADPGTHDVLIDMVTHAGPAPNPNLGFLQAKRGWADSPVCETDIAGIDLPSSGTTQRKLFKFAVKANHNGRGHAMEAGAFADSSQSWCTRSGKGGAWNGTTVNTNDSFFTVNGRQPTSVKLGLNGTDEAGLPNGDTINLPAFGIDQGWRDLADINYTSNGGSFGFNGDSAGYKVNGETVWCAGLNIGQIHDYMFGNTAWPTNVEWPGNYFGDCYQNFLFEPSNNYQTSWGGFTIGSMGNSGFGKRCNFFCNIGVDIPGTVRDGNGRVQPFSLNVAGIKNHDGVGTYNGNPIGQGTPDPSDDAIPAPYFPWADNAAAARGNPFMGSVGEAWLTFEYAPSGTTDGSIYVSKYEPPTHLANGTFNDQNDAINDAKVCIENSGGTEFACNTEGGANNAYRLNGWRKDGIWAQPAPHNPYRVNIYVPSGWEVHSGALNQGARVLPNAPGSPLTCNGSGTFCEYTGIQVNGGDLDYVDIWYQPKGANPCSSSVTMNVSPLSIPEPGQTFQLRFSYINGYNGSFNVTILPSSTLPGVAGGPYPGTGGVATVNVSAQPAGEYIVRYGVDATGTTNDFDGCVGTVRIGNKPYLKVYGNDMAAGAVFKSGNACQAPTNPKATIMTYTKAKMNWHDPGAFATHPDYEQWLGSSTEFAVFALGEIYEHFSAGQHAQRLNTKGSRATRPVLDLTFGNYNPAIQINRPEYFPTVGDTHPALDNSKVINYGGVSGISPCLPDYFANAEDVNVSLNFKPNHPAIGDNQHLVDYVEGNAVIENNIEFANNNWASPSQVPSYYLVVKGNIYIKGSVSELDGVYIAQPDEEGKGGKIYTCANGTLPVSTSNMYDDASAGGCRNKLTVNGSFIARQIRFHRTNGTLRNGASPEGYVGNNNIAEVFTFSPETYLAPLHPSLVETESFRNYDSITSLPPIL